MTWGLHNFDANSSAVREQLRNVQQIQSSHHAFSAILQNGSVVTWGLDNHGSDSSAVQEQLQNVQQIQATTHAFAAILHDGSVVTWGSPDGGGTAAAFRNNCGTYSRCKLPRTHLLRSCTMDLQ